MLFKTNLVVLVGQGEDSELSERKVKIQNIQKGSVIEWTFPTPVLAVKLNKKRIVVVLETQILLYDLASMKLLVTLETPANPRGVVAVSPDDSRPYLAYPSSSDQGDVRIFDMFCVQPLLSISAHTEPLVALAWSPDGACLATCSERGTLIRIYDVQQGGVCMASLRRGAMAASICHLSWGLGSSFVVAASTNGTVHIFKLEDYWKQYLEQKSLRETSYQLTTRPASAVLPSDPSAPASMPSSGASAQSGLPSVQASASASGTDTAPSSQASGGWLSSASNIISSTYSSVSQSMAHYIGERDFASFRFEKPKKCIACLVSGPEDWLVIITEDDARMIKCRFDRNVGGVLKVYADQPLQA